MRKECQVNIITRSEEGEGPVVSAEGLYYLKRGKSHVVFETEGDRCRLEFDDKELIYRRQGDLNFTLSMSDGKKTETELVSAAGRSLLQYETRSYKAEIKKDVININIGYNIADEKRLMGITLTGEFL